MKQRMEQGVLRHCGKLAALAVAVAAMARAEPDAPRQTPQTIRLLAIGNSFSRDALTHLPFIVEASGNHLVFENAIILGGSLEDHVRALESARTNGPAHVARPYGGKSLEELLREDAWDVVTIQQVSSKSHRYETFEPYAGKLVACIRENAPRAEIAVHQTWAYRADHPSFTNGVFTADDMHAGLCDAYDRLAAKYGLRQIPSGDAFQHARLSSRWGGFEPDPHFNPATAKPGELPEEERHSLHRNFYWIKLRDGKDKLVQDCIHANANGHFLLGCVWYEFLFGEDATKNAYQSPYVTPEDTVTLRKLAHEALAKRHETNVNGTLNDEHSK